MEKMMRNMRAQGGALKEFAKFTEHANARDYEALEHILEHFNKTGDDDFVEDVFISLSMFLAARSGGRVTEKTERLADNIGFGVKKSIEYLFQLAQIQDIELVGTFLCRIGDKERKERSPLAIMRELVAQHAEPAASLANLAESLKAAEPMGPQDEEAVPETAVLERKFDAFKESTAEPVKVTLQVWDPAEGVSNEGIDLTEVEFKEVLDTVRKMREGYELAPDPDLTEEAVAALRRASGSVRLRKKESATAAAA